MVLYALNLLGFVWIIFGSFLILLISVVVLKPLTLHIQLIFKINRKVFIQNPIHETRKLHSSPRTETTAYWG